MRYIQRRYMTKSEKLYVRVKRVKIDFLTFSYVHYWMTNPMVEETSLCGAQLQGLQSRIYFVWSILWHYKPAPQREWWRNKILASPWDGQVHSRGERRLNQPAGCPTNSLIVHWACPSPNWYVFVRIKPNLDDVTVPVVEVSDMSETRGSIQSFKSVNVVSTFSYRLYLWGYTIGPVASTLVGVGRDPKYPTISIPHFNSKIH